MKDIMIKKIFFCTIVLMSIGIMGCGFGNNEPFIDPLPEDGIIPSAVRITWDPGIDGGIPPRTTIFVNVKNPPYNAQGNDSADDTSAIQQAIDACPEGQVVYIPEGVYRITDTISINKGIVVRGDGPDLTQLKFYRSSTTNRIY